MLRLTWDLLHAGNQISLRLLKLEAKFNGQVPESAEIELYSHLAHETGHTHPTLQILHQVSDVFANRADLISLLPYSVLTEIALLRPTRRELTIAGRAVNIDPTIDGDEIVAMIAALRRSALNN